jgi:hypothetical protein
LAIIAVIVVLLAALAATAVPQRFSAWLRIFVGIALASGIAGFGFVAFGPKDYLTRWPSLVNVAHPYLLALFSAVAMLLSMGAWLGLVARRILERGIQND